MANVNFDQGVEGGKGRTRRRGDEEDVDEFPAKREEYRCSSYGLPGHSS